MANCDNLDFYSLNNWPPKEYNYKYVSLCAIDAVFSINTNYKTVKNIIKKIENKQCIESLTDFNNWLNSQSTEDLKQIFNSQKIAGLTKINVLKDFINVLLEVGFLEKDDFVKFVNNNELDKKLTEIKGIGNVTVSYFFMLSGDENTIKPDRHIKNFVYNADTGKKINEEEARNVLSEILPELQQKHNNYQLSLRSLDYLIWEYQRQKIYIKLGDITKVDVDAIVNPANETLLGGGGCDGAIHIAAGAELLKECRNLNGCRKGEAKITKGYNLPAKYIIHTVGPIYDQEYGKEKEILTNCYNNCFELAKGNKVKTIAFPCISTGCYKFPKDEAAKIAIRIAKHYINSFKKIIFVCFSELDYKIYKDLLK